jgi:xanthine dehydrogenase accessory factor
MPASLDDILVEAQRWIEAGRGVAIATVVETWGSAPRPVGSHLVIDSKGDFLGSVSGGCVEGDVVTQALETIATGRGQMLEFGVADETAFRAGLSCGGRIRIDVRPLDPGILETLNVERAARRPCAIVTGLGSGVQRLVRAADLAADPLAKQLHERLRRRESGVEETEGDAFFLTVYAPPLRLIAIGAVHIAQALAPIATLAGYETIIIDPRTAFATAERFPGARLIAEWPASALAELGLDAAAAIVLLTHDPRIDDEALIAAMREKCFYIGALGSRKTHARRVERMRAEGFGEAELGRIHAPIGLDIGAMSPAEIAVAILAEIIDSLHRGSRAARSGRAA